MAERKEGETIMLQLYPKAQAYDAEFISKFEMACEAVAAVRNVRQDKGLSPKEALNVRVDASFPMETVAVLVKLANVNVTVGEAEGTGVSAMVRTSKLFVELEGLVNVAEEIAKLEADLKYYQGFLQSVQRKLSNEKFVSGAPAAVVENERKKEADALAKIETIESSLKSLR